MIAIDALAPNYFTLNEKQIVFPYFFNPTNLWLPFQTPNATHLMQKHALTLH